jgi:hypothetical protein
MIVLKFCSNIPHDSLIRYSELGCSSRLKIRLFDIGQCHPFHYGHTVFLFIFICNAQFLLNSSLYYVFFSFHFCICIYLAGELFFAADSLSMAMEQNISDLTDFLIFKLEINDFES